jgi:succinyl-CoA synthetase alpha subunit
MLSQQARFLRNTSPLKKADGYRIPRAGFSTSLRRNGYDDTIQNLKIGSHTRVIFQGFTGKQATANAKESIEWGTNVVGGVKPNASGEHLGLPVLPSVRAAMEQLKPDATGIYVAAHQATAAIEEAIEAEVPLIVAVAEHIPLHDIMRVSYCVLRQDFSRLANRYINRYTLCYSHNRNHALSVPTPQGSSLLSDAVGLDFNLYQPFLLDISASWPSLARYRMRQ